MTAPPHSDFSVIQGKHWYDPLEALTSKLGERGTPSLGQFDDPNGPRRWEWDPDVNSYVVSNLSPEDYAAKYAKGANLPRGPRATAGPLGAIPSLQGLGGGGY
jgi:hypothetical protein